MIQLKIEREAMKKFPVGNRRGLAKTPGADRGRAVTSGSANTLTWKKSGRAKKPAPRAVSSCAKTLTTSACRSPSCNARAIWPKVAELQYGKLPELEKRLKAAQDSEAGGPATQHAPLRTQVGAEEIAEVVSRATGIPVRPR